MAHKNFNKPLGARLKKLRQSKGLTQKQVALKIGISETSVNHHESGRMPGIKAINKYAYFYGCPSRWILHGGGDPDYPEKLANKTNQKRNEKPGQVANQPESNTQALLTETQRKLIAEMEKNRELQSQVDMLRKELSEVKNAK